MKSEMIRCTIAWGTGMAVSGWLPPDTPVRGRLSPYHSGTFHGDHCPRCGRRLPSRARYRRAKCCVGLHSPFSDGQSATLPVCCSLLRCACDSQKR